MSLFSNPNPDGKVKQHTGFLKSFQADIIKFEPETQQEANMIVFKYPYEDFPNGSQLILGQSQMAVFVADIATGSSTGYGERGGEAQVATFIGPCKIKMETGNSRFAPFRNLAQSLTGGVSAYHCTVFFINTAYLNDLAWGTQDPILVEDPEENVNVHVRAQGRFGVHIEQNDESLAVVQATKFIRKVAAGFPKYEVNREQLIDYMRAKILEFVPTHVSQYMVDKRVGVLTITTKTTELSQLLQGELVDYFSEFGLTLDNFSFNSIRPLESDIAVINEMKIKRKRDILEAQGTAAKMDIESEAMARKRAREGYSYQQEKSYEVMGTAAENAGNGIAGAGMGIGMGFGMGNVISQGFGQMAQNMNMAPQQGVPAMGQPQPVAEEKVPCPSCGTLNIKGAKFCIECGTKFELSKKCPDCGKEVAPDAKFCPECGHKFVTETKCPDCGKEVEPGAKFCPECGHKF